MQYCIISAFQNNNFFNNFRGLKLFTNDLEIGVSNSVASYNNVKNTKLVLMTSQHGATIYVLSVIALH